MLRTTDRPQTSTNLIDALDVIVQGFKGNKKSTEKVETAQVNGKSNNNSNNINILSMSSQHMPANNEQNFCGTRMINERGIGGVKATKGAYPWNAALTTPGGIFFCGGVLLDNKYVVTAAHCILGKNNNPKLGARDIVVVIGAHDLKEIEEQKVTVAVKSIHIHPDWHPQVSSYDADIAILELVIEVQYTNYIQPIFLIEPNSPISTISNGQVVGFGKDENDNLGSIAVVMETPINSLEKCIKNKVIDSLLSRRAFCGGRADGTGVCLGDSGSGLYVLKDHKFYLRGIVSASLNSLTNGCDVNNYAVFTDAVKFHSWVKSRGMYNAETRVQQLEAEIEGYRRSGSNQNVDIFARTFG